MRAHSGRRIAKNILLAFALVLLTGCSQWKLAGTSFASGTLFGLLFKGGATVGTTIGTTVERMCFLNGEAIDCSEFPAN